MISGQLINPGSTSRSPAFSRVTRVHLRVHLRVQPRYSRSAALPAFTLRFLLRFLFSRVEELTFLTKCASTSSTAEVKGLPFIPSLSRLLGDGIRKLSSF